VEFQKHSELFQLCRKSTGDNETENFSMLLKLDTNGRVKEVLLYPTTKIGECAREALLRDSFSPPPTPAHWVRVFMTAAN
jgi:hypothetical protein